MNESIESFLRGQYGEQYHQLLLRREKVVLDLRAIWFRHFLFICGCIGWLIVNWSLSAMYRVLPFFTFLICLVFVFKVQHYIQRNKIFVRKCMLPLPKDQHLSLFHAILFPWKAYLLHEEYLDIKLAFDTQRGMDEEEARANEEMERQHEEERAAKEDVMRVAALREELARQKREAEAEAARQLAEKRRTLEQRLLKAFQSKNHPNRSKAIQDFNAAKKAKKDVRAVRFLEHGLALLCQEGDDKTANP